jgi:nucleoside-diphosphate-sugar epimerase
VKGSPHARALVTGASGYLAHALMRRLVAEGARVAALTRGALAGAAGAAPDEVLVGDVTDAGVWDEVLGETDVVYHLAAQTNVYVAQDDPLADLRINALPVLRALEACAKRSDPPALVLAGTSTQCGIPARLPVDESHPDAPVTIYDLHKLLAERYLEQFAARGLARGTCLRLVNVYGPGPASRSAGRGVLNVMIRKALSGERLTVYGRGERLRDYAYVEDVARAFTCAGARLEAVNGRHFVVGTGRGHTLADAARLVVERAARRTGRHAEIVHVDPPPGLSPIEDRDFVADSSAFTRATGWRAQVGLEEGIDRTIEVLLADGGEPA